MVFSLVKIYLDKVRGHRMGKHYIIMKECYMIHTF